MRTLACMHRIIVPAAIALLTATASSAAADGGELSVEVDAPVVEIDSRPPGPRTVRLPDITFTMRVTALCSDDMRTKFVSVSIADTRRTLSAELFGESTTSEQSISIPQRQLAPLTIDNFCLGNDGEHRAEHLYIADALSAQLALHCAGEQREAVLYKAAPLAVELRCHRPAID